MNDAGTTIGPRFSEAVGFAAEIHADQVRKGSVTPYLSHLLATASTVMYCGGDEDVAMAAVLHDAVEDQPDKASIEIIRERFGSRVATLVEAVTEPPKAEPWPVRKDAYEKQLRAASDEAVLISLADKAHNLQTLVDDLHAFGPSVWSKFTAGPEACLERYERLIGLYAERLYGRAEVRALIRRMLVDLNLAGASHGE